MVPQWLDPVNNFIRTTLYVLFWIFTYSWKVSSLFCCKAKKKEKGYDMALYLNFKYVLQCYNPNKGGRSMDYFIHGCTVTVKYLQNFLVWRLAWKLTVCLAKSCISPACHSKKSHQISFWKTWIMLNIILKVRCLKKLNNNNNNTNNNSNIVIVIAVVIAIVKVTIIIIIYMYLHTKTVSFVREVLGTEDETLHKFKFWSCKNINHYNPSNIFSRAWLMDSWHVTQ